MGETIAVMVERSGEPESLHRPLKTIVTYAVALAAAVALALVAPSQWPEGPAMLRVTSRSTTLEVPVEVGDTTALVAADAAFEVEAPDGIPNEDTIVVLVSGDDVADAVVELELADGRLEPIPTLQSDAHQAVATRRPPVQAAVTMGLLGAAIVLWVTEVVPLFVTALWIPVVLAVTGVAPASDALAPFFHPIIALFFGGFLMAEAMKRVGLDHVAAITLVSWLGKSPRSLVFALMGVSAFLSMWMSNTAAAAVLVPIALAVTRPLGSTAYSKTAVLGIAYAATIGGVGSAIGTPANPLAIEFLESVAGQSISFVEWFAYGLPMVVIMLPVIATYLWWRTGTSIDPARFQAARSAADEERRRVGRPTTDQGVVLAVFVAVMLVWLSQTWHGINTGIVAVAGAMALATLGKLKPGDLTRISWSSLLTFGGGLTMGVFLTESGSSDWLATRLGSLEAVTGWVGVAVVAAAALLLTTVASNTATAAVMIPLAIPLAGMLGVSPVLLVIVVAVASSIDFALVIGTPPTLIAYSTELFTVREILAIGSVLDVAGLGILVTLVIAVWRLFGLV
jgi:sodium-dependent dicarboxylate transporter 2/3/5